jgi:nucleoside-diphosphate-sugar epimerase
MSIKTKVLVTTPQGLIGKTLKFQINNSFQERFEFKFLNTYITKENQNAINSEIISFSPDIIIHNAVKLPRGDQKNQTDLGSRNVETFRVILNSLLVSDVKHILAFTTYHVFEPDIAPPFKRIDLNLDHNKHNNWYAKSKVDELILAKEFNRERNFEHVKFIMLPHLFGAHDNFEEGKRHFVSDMIVKLLKAKVNNQEFVEFSTNPEQSIQLLDAEELVKFILNFYLENIESTEFIRILNRGIAIKLVELIEKTASFLDYRGSLKFESVGAASTSRSMYFQQANSEAELNDFYRTINGLLLMYAKSVGTKVKKGGSY